MHRQTVRRKTANFIHGMFKLRHFLAGKPRDHVHVDILKPQLPGQQEGFLRLGGGMIPADAAQSLVVHGLGIDADAPDPQPLQGFQLAPGDGVGPARLHGVLPGVGEQLHDPFH